jgi:hypothetical protein
LFVEKGESKVKYRKRGTDMDNGNTKGRRKESEEQYYFGEIHKKKNSQKRAGIEA